MFKIWRCISPLWGHLGPSWQHRTHLHLLLKTCQWPKTRLRSLFILIYLRSLAKQDISTYIYHSRLHIPDEFHLIFNEVWDEREAKLIRIYRTLSKEATGTIFYNVFNGTVWDRTHDLPVTGQTFNHWVTATLSVCHGISQSDHAMAVMSQRLNRENVQND